jgi:hypothetical protein
VPVNHIEIAGFVSDNIKPLFHDKRLESLAKISLRKVLKRKNPYLFKAKNINTAEPLVRAILDAHISSQEETIFGHFLEELAIFICEKAFGGQKSSSEGIDLEFSKNPSRYLVSIKSGPNWGNSSQIARMKDNFNRARRVLGANTSTKNIVAVNGCCYGTDRYPDKGSYIKLCGQDFWEFISDDPELYTKIIEPLGKNARARNDEFSKNYASVINTFTRDFLREYCDATGNIRWEKVVTMNSGRQS